MKQSRSFFMLAATAIVAIADNAQADTLLVSRAGYYEGSAHWGADYFTDRPAMSMRMESEGDFWFIVNDHGAIRGEGVAIYDFAFGIDWGMQVSMGISVMNVMGVSIDPSVTLELDPASAVHQYELTGQVVDDRLELQVNWPEGTKVNLNLVGTLTGKGTVSGAGSVGSKGSVGASVEAGTVLHTIEWDPITPFGTKAKRVLRLERLSPYGPFAARLDSRNETGQVSAKSGGMLVQKIDFARARAVSTLVERFSETPADQETSGPIGGEADGSRDAASDEPIGDADADKPGGDLEIRSGQVRLAMGESAIVRFREPFSSDDYAVSLAPGKVAFEHGAVLWSQKTSDGFTITIEPRVRGDGSSAIVTVDWMAASITD